MCEEHAGSFICTSRLVARMPCTLETLCRGRLPTSSVHLAAKCLMQRPSRRVVCHENVPLKTPEECKRNVRFSGEIFSARRRSHSPCVMAHLHRKCLFPICSLFSAHLSTRRWTWASVKIGISSGYSINVEGAEEEGRGRGVCSIQSWLLLRGNSSHLRHCAAGDLSFDRSSTFKISQRNP